MRWSDASWALLLVALLSFVCAVPRAASAQSPTDDAAAEALFTEGRELMEKKQYAEACAKFQKSSDIAPAVGTLLNLGECYEKVGKMASAWSRYKAAENLAVKTKDKRSKGAAERARAIEKKVSRLTVNVAEAANVEGLKITSDDVELKPALWGTAAPIDAGAHVIRATAPGKADWKTGVQIAEGAASTVNVPGLASVKEGGAPSAPAAPPPSTSQGAKTEAPPAAGAPAQTPKDQGKGLGPQKTWALVAMGVSVVGFGAGTFLALGAKSKYDDAKKSCTNGTSGCDAEAASMSQDARSQGNLATVAFGVGIAGAATGAVLWLTAPKKNPATGAQASRKVALIPSLGVSDAGILLSAELP